MTTQRWMVMQERVGALAVHSTLPSWTLLPLVPPSPFQGSLQTWIPPGGLLLGEDQLHGSLLGSGTDPIAIGCPRDRVERFAS